MPILLNYTIGDLIDLKQAKKCNWKCELHMFHCLWQGLKLLFNLIVVLFVLQTHTCTPISFVICQYVHCLFIIHQISIKLHIQVPWHPNYNLAHKCFSCHDQSTNELSHLFIQLILMRARRHGPSHILFINLHSCMLPRGT